MRTGGRRARKALESQANDATGPGTLFAFDESMVGGRSVGACARIDRNGDGRLGRYQPLVVAVMTALLLALVSVPKVTLALH